MPLTALSMRNDTWMDGVAVAGQDLRLQQASAFLTGASPSGSTGIAARPGVRYGTGDPLKISTSSGMTLAVNAGIAWVQGTASANAGMYTGCLDTAGTVTLATSDPTNPRIDNIIVQVTDVGTSSSTTVVTPQTGTPAASPVAPTLPANSLLLATVAVGAGVSSITAGNITDKRVWTTSVGGIVPMANVTGGISGMAGLYAHDLSSGRLKVSDGSGNARQPKVGSFSPITVASADRTVSSGSFTQLFTPVSFTVDGATEVTFYASWLGFSMASPTVGQITAVEFSIDGSFVNSNCEWYYRQDSTSTNVGGGGSFTTWVTPTAGTHTATIVGALIGGSNATVISSLFFRLSPSIQ